MFSRCPIQTNWSQAFAFTWTSLVLIALSFVCLLILYLYRYRCEKRMKNAGEQLHRKRGSIMDRLLARCGRRGRRSYGSYTKRASYDSTYDEDLRREKEIERGGVRNYPVHPPTMDREAGYEVAAPVAARTSDGGNRRFAGNAGGTYTTPGARSGPAPPATPPQLNKSRPGNADLPVRNP